jgi:hypothetical protein
VVEVFLEFGPLIVLVNRLVTSAAVTRLVDPVEVVED